MIENDIKQQLITAGIELSANIVLGAVPATPGNIIVIASGEGVLTALENSTLASKNVLIKKSVSLPNMPDIRQTLSILVINDDYSAAYEKIQDVYDELVGVESGYKVCNGKQMYFVPIQSPYFMKAENAKNYFVLNVNVNTTK